MDKPNLDDLPAAVIAVMLLWAGVALYREPTLVKSVLMRLLGPVKGGALYAALIAGGAVGWWTVWRTVNRQTLITDLRRAMQPPFYEAAGA